MDRTTTTTAPFTYVTLIGYGIAPAKPAQDLQVGDVTVWNYGFTETITSITPKGSTMLTLTIQSRDGHIFNRNVKRTRLIGMKVTL